MGIEKIITKIVSRGLKSPNCVLSKTVKDGRIIQIFKNPKSNAAVIKHIYPEGIVRSFGYSGKQNILANQLKTTLDIAPECIIHTATPKKFVEKYLKGGRYDFISDQMRVAQDGLETTYRDFFGRWIKGTSEQRSMQEVMNSF